MGYPLRQRIGFAAVVAGVDVAAAVADVAVVDAVVLNRRLAD